MNFAGVFWFLDYLLVYYDPLNYLLAYLLIFIYTKLINLLINFIYLLIYKHH